MLSNKHISKITVVIISLALILCIGAMIFSNDLAKFTAAYTYGLKYQDEIFDTDKIINLNIIIDSDSWQNMLNNATDEEYCQCTVVINNTTLKNVGIRPKGNTSLSSVANDPDNNRYSFKLEFDHYVDGQTYLGLDKLVLNNNYADATQMKEAIIYDMFGFMDGDASLYNYAKMSVNGDYFGIYLALEAVEDSFMLRNYGSSNGYLYKPDGVDMAHGKQDNKNQPPNEFSDNHHRQDDFKSDNPPKGNDKDMDFGNTEEAPETSFMQDNFDVGDKENESKPPNGFNRHIQTGGANLNYIDDDLESYSDIWDGQVNKSNDTAYERVVTALKNIGNKENVTDYVNSDQIYKYMTVHNFAVNDDSLSDNMAHNYYLYESSGILSIIPWDYNLSFGGMNSKNATDVVNTPIDDKYSSTAFFDFVFESDEYKNTYHTYYQKLMDEYFDSGIFDETYARIRTQIDDLVKIDPNAMYTYDEYTKAADTLYETIKLRAESVKGQLNGSIPSASDNRSNLSENLIDASHINLSDMGQFMGGHDGQPQDNKKDNKQRQNDAPDNIYRGVEQGDNKPEHQNNPQNRDIVPSADDIKIQPHPSFDNSADNSAQNNQNLAGFPNSSKGKDISSDNQGSVNHIQKYSYLYISIAIFGLALIFTHFYKKHNY